MEVVAKQINQGARTPLMVDGYTTSGCTSLKEPLVLETRTHMVFIFTYGYGIFTIGDGERSTILRSMPSIMFPQGIPS